jgi:hypothetical protein
MGGLVNIDFVCRGVGEDRHFVNQCFPLLEGVARLEAEGLFMYNNQDQTSRHQCQSPTRSVSFFQMQHQPS